MSTDEKFDALFGDGVMLGDSLVIKAVPRVVVRDARYPAAQAMVDELARMHEARMTSLLRDIQVVLEADVRRSNVMPLVVSSDGKLLLKAQGAAAPAAPKALPKTVNQATGDRVKTASGYNHVVNAGSRGGKFWRDEKGNVRYGEKPTGNYQQPANPEHVVEHFKKYHAPNPFLNPHEMGDLHEAVFNSDAMPPAEANFMAWWKNNFDLFLDAFKISKKDLKDAGGLNNIVLKFQGRQISYGEAVELWFKNSTELFVGDEDYGEVENEDDIVEAVRNTMDAYGKALHEDPKVAALAQQIAEKKDAERNALYIQAERQHDEFSPLAGDLTTVNDPNDLSVRFTAGMAQMGLIEVAKAGSAAKKRMRGTIVPKSSLLFDGAQLWKDDQLDRFNASQLMNVYIAERLQDSFVERDGSISYSYVPVVNKKAPEFHNDNSNKVFGEMCKQLGIEDNDDTARHMLAQKLEDVARVTCDAFNNYNRGFDPLFKDVLKMKVKDVAGVSNVLEEFRKKAADRDAYIKDVLAAQEDTSFTMPPTMQKGVWNGKTMKNPDKPELGVWEPMDYQKKYLNWMHKVKRGVLAAGMGLGKTPMIITFMEQLRAKGEDIPAIAFLPPSLMEQWPKEIAKFAPEMADKVLNLSGMSLEERKIVLQSDLAKNARYILMSTGTLTSGKGDDPNIDESENDGTGGMDNELIDTLKELNGAVFIDEAHQGGYKKAGNTRHEIAKSIMQDRDYAFGMTATPMPNDPMDLYHLANLFAPGSVGDEDLWKGRTAGAIWDESKGRYDVTHPEQLAELNQRVKPFVFYKTLQDADVQKDQKALPDKKGFTDNATEGDLSISEHKSAENGLSQFDYFKAGGVIDTMVALRIQRLHKERLEAVDRGELDPKTGQPIKPYNPKTLQMIAGGMRATLHRQASISPGLIDPTYKRSDGKVAHSPKIKAFCDDIVEHFSNGGTAGEDQKPAVAFCSYPGKAFPLIKKALAERGIDPSRVAILAGDVSQQERGYYQDLLNSGHLKVLLVGTMSGGAGLNLQEKANAVFHIDEPPTPAAKRQAQGRVHRTGQKNTVHEKTYRTMNTMDDVYETRLAGKQTMVSALLGKDMPTADTFNVDEDIKVMLGRVKGTEFDEDQIKSIMENSKKYDIDSAEHKQAQHLFSNVLSDEDWKENASRGGMGGVSAQLTDEDFQPSPEGKAKLKKKGAHGIADAFDESEFRAQWAASREQRMAKQKYQAAVTIAQVLKQQGEPDRAAQYEKKAAELKEAAKGYHADAHAKADAADKTGDKESAKDHRKRADDIASHFGLSKDDAKTAKKDPKDIKVPGKKEVAKPAAKKVVKEQTKKTKEKPVHHENNMGVKLHAKKNPYDGESSKKIKGTKVQEAEASFVFDAMKDSKHKSLDDFVKKVIKPVWDDDGGKNPWSVAAAKEYVQSIMDAMSEHLSYEKEK